MSVLALIGNVDGGGSCASFVQEGFFTGKVQAVAVHHLCPGVGMIGHGVEQHAVHVEQDGTQVETFAGMAAQIVADVFFKHEGNAFFSF